MVGKEIAVVLRSESSDVLVSLLPLDERKPGEAISEYVIGPISTNLDSPPVPEFVLIARNEVRDATIVARGVNLILWQILW